MSIINLATLFALLGLCHGFAPPPASRSVSPTTTTTTTTLHYVPDTAQLMEAQAARAAFVLCFFGASGSAATGRIIIPKIDAQWKTYLSLKGKGKSLGGEEMALFGYPEPVYTDDVIKVLNNKMSIAQMASKFPPTDPTWDTSLNFESMARANKDTSQMAVRAVFDSMALGINKNQIYQPEAEEKLALYRNDMELLKKDNNKAKAVGVAAFFSLLTLLGLADYFAVYHLLKGWFPGWEGFADFPTSLFDERGLNALPGCFMYDLPL